MRREKFRHGTFCDIKEPTAEWYRQKGKHFCGRLQFTFYFAIQFVFVKMFVSH